MTHKMFNKHESNKTWDLSAYICKYFTVVTITEGIELVNFVLQLTSTELNTTACSATVSVCTVKINTGDIH